MKAKKELLTRKRSTYLNESQDRAFQKMMKEHGFTEAQLLRRIILENI